MKIKFTQFGKDILFVLLIKVAILVGLAVFTHFKKQEKPSPQQIHHHFLDSVHNNHKEP